MTESKRKWFYDIWFVIVMLLTIGPFGFPLLWKSPKFSRGVKWALTILFTLITILAIYLSIEMAKFTWRRFQEMQSILY